MPAPPLHWVSASVPKRGHAAAENEDAVAADPAALRFAVADGATEGWLSGGWAAHLAAAYVRRPPSPADFPGWLADVRRGWVPPAASGATPWYAEVKREQGSFATLVGLEFRPAASGPGLAWKAVGIGDSCLLVLRGGRFAVAFPVSSVEQFGNQPPLVPSSPDRACPEPDWLAGWAEPDDLFLLASDAVARRLLGLAESVAADALVAAVRGAVTSGEPDGLVTALIGLGDVLNDDASVLAVFAPRTPE